MKRNPDLVREIMLRLEDKDRGAYDKISGYDKATIGFHVFLLGQAGFADVAETTVIGDSYPQAIPKNLTWAGYEFLDAAKDDSVWAVAKKKVIPAGGEIAFAVLKEWLISEAKRKLGLPG